EEEERVFYAANIVKESRMYFEYLPDFSVEDIERTIEKNIIKHDVEYVFHDYLHSSIGILSGFAKKSGINLREDQILLLMSDKLKQLANKFEVFIMTSTQLNDGWKEAWRKKKLKSCQLIHLVKHLTMLHTYSRTVVENTQMSRFFLM